MTSVEQFTLSSPNNNFYPDFVGNQDLQRQSVPQYVYDAFEESPLDSLDPLKENSTEKEESIFNYYSVTNEANFLRENPQLPQEQKEYYLKENILRFLGEFAGKVPYTKITYILKDDGLYYGDLKASNNYRQTSTLSGATEREKAEAEGFEQIEEGLLRPSKDLDQPANTAYWISPPKDANYGFVFFFTKDSHYDETLKGYKVTEHILRYAEKRGKTSKSNRISYGINNNLDHDRFKKNPEEFLRNPILVLSDPELKFKKILNLVDIGDERISQSKEFEDRVEKRLSGLVNQYTCTIIMLSKHEPEEPEYHQIQHQAEKLLTTIFNSARMIKHIVEEPENYNHQNPLDGATDKELIAYFSRKTATVTGEGSCPVTKNDQPAYLSSFDIYAVMEAGNPVERMMADENKFLNQEKIPLMESEYFDNYECPHCHKPLSGEKKNDPSSWRKICDHCNEDVRCDKEAKAA